MRKLVFACVLLLLLTNIVVLAGVAYNRSGEPVLSLELTERELPIRQSNDINDENSGTSLSLQWQTLNTEEGFEYLPIRYGNPSWLDDEKLSELGFDTKKFKSDNLLAAEVILVLEYSGEVYHKALTSAEHKEQELRQSVVEYHGDSDRLKELSDFEKQLTKLKTSQSRLFAIDAGMDEQVLIKKYADRNNVLLVRGEIVFSRSEDEVSGFIRQLFIQQIHVPLPLSEQLTTWTNGEIYTAYNKDPIPPRYTVRLNMGKRLEPWIESATQMENDVGK